MAEKFSRTQLAKFVSKNADSADIAQEVAAFLIETRKTNELESLMRDVMEVRASDAGTVELTARSAYPLDASAKAEIDKVAHKLYPNATSVVIHEVVDPEVIGGVRLQFANASLDLTIQSKLHRLKEAVA